MQKDLPRVLMVGDSICNHYREEVLENLKGRMNVSWWVSSYCVTSPEYLRILAFKLALFATVIEHECFSPYLRNLILLNLPCLFTGATADWNRPEAPVAGDISKKAGLRIC